jgi:hAT family C-terminal dimerisation region
MVTSSAASERGFSTMGFQHSKLRNRQGYEKVKKLIFIKTNAQQLTDNQGGVDWETIDNDNATEDGVDDCNLLEIM